MRRVPNFPADHPPKAAKSLKIVEKFYAPEHILPKTHFLIQELLAGF